MWSRESNPWAGTRAARPIATADAQKPKEAAAEAPAVEPAKDTAAKTSKEGPAKEAPAVEPAKDAATTPPATSANLQKARKISGDLKPRRPRANRENDAKG